MFHVALKGNIKVMKQLDINTSDDTLCKVVTRDSLKGTTF